MKLQNKVILILAGAWIIISLIIYADSKFVLAKNYEKLEKKLIVDEINDTRKAYDRMLFTLSLYALAWAQWDDAYEFMKFKNPKFIKSNFVPGTYTSSKINFFIFYDTAGKFYYGQAYNLIDDKIVPIPKSLLAYLDKHNQFVRHQAIKSNKIGILDTAEGLVIMSSQPVITGNGQGPVGGTLLMGYYLTDQHINNLSEVVDMKLSFYPLPLSSPDKALAVAYNKLKLGQDHVIMPVNAKMAYGFIMLKDIANKPVGILRMEIPRIVYLEGIMTMQHYLAIYAVLGVLILVLTWYLLKIFVLNRVLNVSQQIIGFSKENKFEGHIQSSGTDELSDMISSINHMMKLITLSQKQLHHMAHHDVLTLLPNRSLYFEKLRAAIMEAKKSNDKIAVLFLDMDAFKSINDLYGHDMGDKLLKAAADRLRHVVKETDFVARQSGDEFIIFLKHIADVKDINATADRIIHEMSCPFKIKNIQIRMAFSIGISIFPDDSDDVEELIRLADNAMYRAKNNGGNSYNYHQKPERINGGIPIGGR